MKKILSILLAVLMLLSTMTVLTVLPALATTTENEPVNLIVNGDGSLGEWANHTDENGNKYETVTDPTDPNYGFIVAANAYGWRAANVSDIGVPYANASFHWNNVNHYDILNKEDAPLIRANAWNQTMQDFKIEANKTYKVSADVTFMPVSTAKNYTASFDIQVDGGAGVFINQNDPSTTFVAKTGGLYDLYDDNTSHPLYNSIHVDTSSGKVKTATSNSGTECWDFGDLKTYSFCFDANDVISGEKLTDDDNDGYYDVRLLFANNSGLVLLFDNVSVYESVRIVADKGGYVNTDSVLANTESTVTATPYYGNSFKGWYSGDTLVSTNTTYTAVITDKLTAKFNVYNLIDDGNFATSSVGDTSPIALKNSTNASTAPATFKVLENNSGHPEFGANILEYTSHVTSGQWGQRDITIPVTVKKNTNYIFRYSFQNDNSKFSGCTIANNTAISGPQLTTMKFGWQFTRHSTGLEYNAWGWSHGYSESGTLKTGNNIMMYFNNGGVASGDTLWNDSTVIFNSLDNEGTVYLVIGMTTGCEDKTTLLANLQFSELCDTPINGTTVAFENGLYTINRDPYITQKYQMVNAAGGVKPVTYFDTIYTFADDKTETTATASANASYKFTGWYNNNELVSENTTISYSALTKDNLVPKFKKVVSYTITATAEKNADGIYGGYVINKSQVINEEENVTVNAVTYAGNTFDGWYNGETKVSSNESYTFTAASNVDLVAKWNVENIWPDSGYENTEIGVQQISHRNPNGMWHSAGSPWNWGYASATTDYKYTGNASMAVTHRHNEISAKLKVEPNTDYELSFNWLLGNSLQQDNVNPSYLKSVLIRGWDSSQIGYTDVTTYHSADFQNTKVIFNSGDNSEVFIGFTYYAGSKPMYFDDVCLVPFDKETGTTDYFRVTYDFGAEEMENVAEYVKAGEYTLRKNNFFFREPVMKDFVSYTVNGEEKAVGDVITVDSDVTVKMNYKDHVRSELNDNTTFDPDNYVFTLAALPDPQKLLVHHPDYYGKIGEWLIANKEEFKIAGLMALGDLTEYGGWPQYEAAFANLKDVIKTMPVGISLGNHDYPGGNSKGNWEENYEKEYNTVIYNHFFKEAMVEALLKNNGGAYPYVNKAIDGYEVMSKDAKIDTVDNTYNIYNDEYIVISMEIFPRTETLDWAAAIAKANPDKKIIVTTHSHLSDKGELLDDHDYYAIAKNETTNSAAFVREYLLEANSNIVMMVCGHDSSQKIVYDERTREDGSIYYEVLIDNQDDDENYQGVGMVAFLGFRADGTIDTTYYSTIWNKYFKSDVNEVTFDFGITSREDVAENVTEGETIDTSAIDTEKYFIPYGSVYYMEGNEYKYVEKNEDGTFTAPVAGNFNLKGFKKPAFGKLLTFGASANPTDGTVQYGSYIESIAEGTKYGTMFVTGDWDAFVNYYKQNKNWTVDEIIAKVSAMYDSKIEESTTGNVPISAGSEIVVFSYKVDQSNYMYRNENGVLEFALRVVGLDANRTCTAVGYAKSETACDFSENVITTSFSKLVGNN